MKFDKCTHCGTIPVKTDKEYFHHPQNSIIPLCSHQPLPWSPDNHWSVFYQLRLIMSVLEFHMNGIYRIDSFVPGFISSA